MVIIEPQPGEEEVAAVLAAISAHLAEEAADQPIDQFEQEWKWHGSAIMVKQGLIPRRLPQRPAWGNVERLRRVVAGTGGTGIVGL